MVSIFCGEHHNLIEEIVFDEELSDALQGHKQQ